MRAKRVLIFGGKSDIGGAIKDLYPETVVVDKDVCDIRSASEVWEALVSAAPEAVVNCAGVSHVQVVTGSSMEGWREEMEVNLFGSYIVARQVIAYEQMSKFAPYGSFGRALDSLTPEPIPMVFIASVAGMYGKPEHSGYSASKAGVISLVQSLALEGHLAYAVSPGRVDTKMREHDYPGEDVRTRLSTAQVAEVVADCIKGRYEPGDNIVIRKRGVSGEGGRTLRRVDKGQPWRGYLNVQPLGAPKLI